MKTSRIVGLLALLQLIWMVLVIHKVIDGPTSFAFDVLHEDLIFIINLMTYFIVRAIEESKKYQKECEVSFKLQEEYLRKVKWWERLNLEHGMENIL